MIGLEKESLIETGLIMKRKAPEESMLGRKASGAQEVQQEARREECNA